MNVKEFYNNIGGNYEDFLKRVSGNETFILKWVKKFSNDPTYEALEKAVVCKDFSEILKAAHTLKGVCANLSFIKLCNDSADIVTYLRETDGQSDEKHTEELFEKVKAEYKKICSLIQELE